MRCFRKYISYVLQGILLCLCIISPSLADQYNIVRGTVTKVIDGDTVIIRPVSGKLFKCRLYGIDAPEMSHNGNPGEPYSRAAERELNNLILHTSVEITLTGDSSYDREICVIKKRGVDINLEMVRSGYARAYRRYLKEPYASEYIEAENEAKKMRRGIWRQVTPR